MKTKITPELKSKLETFNVRDHSGNEGVDLLRLKTASYLDLVLSACVTATSALSVGDISQAFTRIARVGEYLYQLAEMLDYDPDAPDPFKDPIYVEFVKLVKEGKQEEAVALLKSRKHQNDAPFNTSSLVLPPQSSRPN